MGVEEEETRKGRALAGRSRSGDTRWNEAQRLMDDLLVSLLGAPM